MGRLEAYLTEYNMRLKYRFNAFVWTMSLVLLVVGCNSGDPEIDNPFDKDVDLPEHEVIHGDTVDIEPKTIQYLHKYVFKPTCANSGCHDGNFEPDFRTIESSYNTLVNQPIIKNDEMNPLQVRVSPGNADVSMLVKRLEIDLNNNSGIMPLSLEANSDWPEKKLQYIQDIKDWINNGALDQDTQARGDLDFPPQFQGMIAVVNGNIASRSGRYSPIPVPSGGTIEIWFSYADDKTAVSALSGGKINTSLEANTFDPANEIVMTYSSTPKTAEGFTGEDVDFHHKATLNLSTWNSGDVIWVRSQISDGKNDVELPNDNSLFNAKQYAAIRLN
jgi:hypothetical protein